MESRFDPVLKTGIRHTESTDARLGIRQDEKGGQERRHQKQDDGAPETGVWEDITTVSLPALIAFLNGLTSARHGTAPADDPAIQRTTPAAPAQTKNARASQAYQTAYRATHPEPPAAVPPPDNPDLSTDEQRAIHRLLARLSMLQEQNVQSLVIRRAGTFLESIQLAVDDLG